MSPTSHERRATKSSARAAARSPCAASPPARSCTPASVRSSRPSSSTSGSRASASGCGGGRTGAAGPVRRRARRRLERARRRASASERRPRRRRASSSSASSAISARSRWRWPRASPSAARRAGRRRARPARPRCARDRAHALAARRGDLLEALARQPVARRHRLLGSLLAAREPRAVDGRRVLGARGGVAGPRCTLYTYSASTATRVALLLAGWAVGVGDAIGDKAQTTAAAVAPSDSARPLDRRWLARLSRPDVPLPSDAPPTRSRARGWPRSSARRSAGSTRRCGRRAFG